MFVDNDDACVEPYMQQWLGETDAMDQPMGCSDVTVTSAVQQSPFAQMSAIEQKKFLKTHLHTSKRDR